MRNPLVRAFCRIVAIVAAALALYRYAWLPAHANHVIQAVMTRTRAALEMGHGRAVMVARENIELLRPVADAAPLSVDYHMVYAANARILGRNDDAVEHYTGALAADHRPEIYFERGLTYLDEGKLDAATADIALAARFNPGYSEDVDAGMQERITALNKSVPYNPPPR
jgi:tetratricopeptide (TPR) repeat protein